MNNVPLMINRALRCKGCKLPFTAVLPDYAAIP